jgi:hypothetical protein
VTLLPWVEPGQGPAAVAILEHEWFRVDPATMASARQVMRLLEGEEEGNEKGAVFLRDMSSNGTWVNGNKVGKDRMWPLEHNSEICFTGSGKKVFHTHWVKPCPVTSRNKVSSTRTQCLWKTFFPDPAKQSSALCSSGHIRSLTTLFLFIQVFFFLFENTQIHLLLFAVLTLYSNIQEI